jgi:epimerase transport system membrane fusion protein
MLTGFLPAAVWLGWAPLTSAVVAPGLVKVDLDRRQVQHAQGGMVREVLVRDGQQVDQGQPMLVLGDVAVGVEAQRAGQRVLAERVLIARLEAELKLSDRWAVAADLRARAGTDAWLAQVLASEETLLKSRIQAHRATGTLLRQQLLGLDSEQAAWAERIRRSEQALQSQRAELATNLRLQSENFVSSIRVQQIESAVADYAARIEESRAEMARVAQRHAELEIRQRSLDDELRQRAGDLLRGAATRLAEAEQDQRKTDDAASRQVLTAPVNGQVMNLRVNTPGAMAGAHETLVEVVPNHPRLVVEAHIRPDDVGRVATGQTVQLRFPAIRPELRTLIPGRISYLSPDRLADSDGRNPYFAALIDIDPEAVGGSQRHELRAGVTAEVFIIGEVRSAMSYLVEPVTDILRRGTRER